MSEAIEAYAKLWGRDMGSVTLHDADERGSKPFCAFVTKLPCKLGRPTTSEAPDVVLDHKSLSRHHATIDQHGNGPQLEIQIHGKNGIVLNGDFIGKGETRVLESGSTLKMGPYCVYFLPALASQCE